MTQIIWVQRFHLNDNNDANGWSPLLILRNRFALICAAAVTFRNLTAFRNFSSGEIKNEYIIVRLLAWAANLASGEDARGHGRRHTCGISHKCFLPYLSPSPSLWLSTSFRLNKTFPCHGILKVVNMCMSNAMNMDVTSFFGACTPPLLLLLQRPNPSSPSPQ